MRHFPAMPVSLDEATQVIARAHAKATELGVRVTVAVVDEGGLLIALSRMDGAIPLSPQIAEAKAVGAVMMSRPEALFAPAVSASSAERSSSSRRWQSS